MVFKTQTDKESYTTERCHIIEIMNTRAEEGISIARARVEPGVTTELHQLDVGECYYILEGKGLVELSGTTREEVGQGDVVLIPAEVPQRITNLGDVGLVFLCVCYPRFRPESYTKLE